MNMAILPYVCPLAIAAFFYIWLGIVAWKNRDEQVAGAFGGVLFTCLEWTVTYAFELMSPDLESKLFWANAQFAGISFLPIFWILLVLRITGRQKPPVIVTGMMVTIAVTTNVLAWTSESHQIFRVYPTLDITSHSIPMVNADYGPWQYLVHVPYFFGTFAFSVVLLYDSYRTAGPLFRRQYTVVAICSILPLAGGALYTVGIPPFRNWNPATAFLSLSALMIAFARLRLGLFQLIPFARAALIENMTDSVVVLDEKERMVDANPTAVRTFSLQDEQVHGSFLREIGRFGEALHAAYHAAETPDFTVTLDTDSGRREFSCRAVGMVGGGGQALGRLLVLHDITELHEAHRALIARESYLSALNKAAGVLMNTSAEVPYQDFVEAMGPLLNASRIYVFMNHTAPDGTLLTSQVAEWHAPGTSSVLAFPETQNLPFAGDLEGWLQRFREGKAVEARAGELSTELRLFLEPQGILSFLLIPVLVDGELVGFVGFDNCVSERPWEPFEQDLLSAAAQNLAQAIKRVRYERELRNSRERLELALQGAELGTWDFHAVTGEASYDDRWAGMLGYRKEELEGRHSLWEELLHPEDRDRTLAALQAHLDGATPSYEAEFRLRSKSGDWVWILSKGRVIERDSEGRPLRAAGTHLDITQHKRGEVERLAIERQIQQTQKLESLGVLAGGIAHDFNNLLMAILGHADLAEQELSPMSPVREHVKGIVQSSRRAAELCRQMLAYSGRGHFVVETIDLRELVEEIVHLLRTSISKKATLNLHMDRALPPIEGDASQLRQVIMNLVLNASESFGDDAGVITISATTRHCDAAMLRASAKDVDLPDGSYVCLEVADTGCGMSQETQDRIFDPFFTTKFAGRGLGLAAVQGIVRGHRGLLHVESRQGEGTSFCVCFPASAKRVRQHAEDANAQSGAWHGAGAILLVDDEDTVLDVSTAMLRKLGFEVITARDGREAIAAYEAHQREIACVLIDMTMPVLDGAEAFRAIRRINPEARVIMSSGYNEQEVTGPLTGEGLAGFIQKPYQLDTLRNEIKRVISSFQAPRGAQ